MRPLSRSILGQKALVLFIAAIAASVILSGCGGRESETLAESEPTVEAPGSQPATTERETTAGETIDGKALFEIHCAKCHGLKGLGDGPSAESLRTGGVNIAILQGTRSDEELFLTISQGRGVEMPPWGIILTEEERWALVEYVRTLGSE